MHIAWSEFTPYSSLFGGMLIGLAASLLLIFAGRIAGVAGIVANLFALVRNRNWKENAWRGAFVIGLIVSPVAYSLFAELPTIHLDRHWLEIILAGLLVGIGTRLGSGCTSGHGVCGLARLSVRSLHASLCFMATGFITVFLLKQLF